MHDKRVLRRKIDCGACSWRGGKEETNGPVMRLFLSERKGLEESLDSLEEESGKCTGLVAKTQRI